MYIFINDNIRITFRTTDECLTYMMEYSGVMNRNHRQVFEFIEWANKAHTGDMIVYETYIILMLL